MGNTPTKVGIRLESTAEAGSILKGRIYLSVQTVRERACSLNLILEGEENAQIVTYEKINDKRQKKINRDSSVLYKMEVPLIKFIRGQIKRGQYEYPFEWPLPDDLPSSMLCQIDNKSSFCEIKYKLTAYLDKGNGLPKISDSTISTSVVLLGGVSDRNRQDRARVALQEYPVNASCFGNQGTITMGLDVDTAVAAPQGTIHVGIIGKNNSTSSINHFTVRFVETVTCSAEGRSRDFSRNLCTTKVSSPEHTAWDSTSKFSGNFLRRLSPHTNDGSKKNETEKTATIDNSWFMTKLFLPIDTRDTYLAGKNIGVRHALIVEAVTSRFMTTAPTSIESSMLMKVQRRMPPLSSSSINDIVYSSSTPAAAAAAKIPAPSSTPAAAAANNIPAPSAPPGNFDDENDDKYDDQQLHTVLETSLQAIETTAIATAPAEVEQPTIPVAIAELLPADWKAEEAEVVHISKQNVKKRE